MHSKNGMSLRGEGGIINKEVLFKERLSAERDQSREERKAPKSVSRKKVKPPEKAHPVLTQLVKKNKETVGHRNIEGKLQKKHPS